MNRRLDCRVRGLSETADRRIFHRHADLIEQRDLLSYAAEGLSAGNSEKRLFLPDCADATGDALPARLIAEERGDAQQDLRHIHRVVEGDDDSGAKRRLRGARTLEGE